jgi:hypothetical protein
MQYLETGALAANGTHTPFVPHDVLTQPSVFSQKSPAKPVGQLHKVLKNGKSTHEPPFWHGFDEQPFGIFKVFSQFKVFWLKTKPCGHCIKSK